MDKWRVGAITNSLSGNLGVALNMRHAKDMEEFKSRLAEQREANLARLRANLAETGAQKDQERALERIGAEYDRREEIVETQSGARLGLAGQKWRDDLLKEATRTANEISNNQVSNEFTYDETKANDLRNKALTSLVQRSRGDPALIQQLYVIMGRSREEAAAAATAVSRGAGGGSTPAPAPGGSAPPQASAGAAGWGGTTASPPPDAGPMVGSPGRSWGDLFDDGLGAAQSFVDTMAPAGAPMQPYRPDMPADQQFWPNAGMGRQPLDDGMYAPYVRPWKNPEQQQLADLYAP